MAVSVIANNARVTFYYGIVSEFYSFQLIPSSFFCDNF